MRCLLKNTFDQIVYIETDGLTKFLFSFQQLAVLEDFIRSSKVFLSPESKLFAQDLVHNRLPVLQRPNLSRDEYVMLELTVHLEAVLLFAKQDVVQPLFQLALLPSRMQVRLVDVIFIVLKSGMWRLL